MFPFSNCFQIPALNCKFKRLTISPQRMTLLVKIMLTVVDKGPYWEGSEYVFPCTISDLELF